MKNTIKLLFLGLFLFGITATRAQISTANGGTLSPNVPTTNTNVGIGTTAPTEKLDVVGNIKASGTATFASTITAPTFNISGQTASTLASFDTAKNVVSLPTVTYPSLSELSFVKGATSSLQQQINYIPGNYFNFATSPFPGYVPYNTTGVKFGATPIYFNGTNIGIGTTAPTEKLDVVGNIKASGTATFASTVTATQLISNVATGTSPITVTSTTVVPNLNADLLDGLHATSFQPSSANLTAINNIAYTGTNVAAVKTASGWVSKDAAILDTPYAGSTTIPVKFVNGWGYMNAYQFIQTSGNYNISGIITAPTAALGTNTTQLATTAFVLANTAGLTHNQAWSTLTSTPTTLAGYSITDAIKNMRFVSSLNTISESGIYREEQPSSGYSFTTTLNMNSADGRQQLTIDRNGSGMKFRGSITGGTADDFGTWKTVIHDGNVGNYTIQNQNSSAQSANMWISGNGIFGGNVGIGSSNPDQKLTVKGKIHAEEIIVDLAVPADYVFQKYYTGKSELKSDYVMPTLAEIESFTKKNNHLPNVPSAQEIKQNGVLLGEMSNILLQKVEELTLYAIEQDKKAALQQQELNRLKAENENYKSLAERLSEIEIELKK
ncbi:autotransporter outer membrane beta-barrel domain-containing protein [Flavobacterium restrictum]|uniref:Peptidase S74 domain-containing protein n=1 Tax=Flavobacterium restrictum TaxID=2594428 RepID=A0A553E7T8_9FLAO|nr:hypothetical protein [Flavobacterium restrictum]TRX40893.1 hypothetical protein FNW21_06230 [Flavobacterium restrictum]